MQVYFLGVNPFEQNPLKFAQWLIGQLTAFRFYTPAFLHDFGVGIPNGVYIYHMVAVNIFVELGLLRHVSYYLAVIILTYLVSVISWKWIEKPALRLKKSF